LLSTGLLHHLLDGSLVRFTQLGLLLPLYHRRRACDDGTDGGVAMLRLVGVELSITEPGEKKMW
jgi:hypothetical protein